MMGELNDFDLAQRAMSEERAEEAQDVITSTQPVQNEEARAEGVRAEEVGAEEVRAEEGYGNASPTPPKTAPSRTWDAPQGM